MTEQYYRFKETLKLIEDKGYAEVRIRDDYWHYKIIICETPSVTHKLKEYLEDIDDDDYFHCIDGNRIWVFNTRRFVKDFDNNAMQNNETQYFEWDELEKDNGRNYSFYYPLRHTFIKILEKKGYEFEHPHNSAYCHCTNINKRNDRIEKENRRRQEIDDFIANL